MLYNSGKQSTKVRLAQVNLIWTAEYRQRFSTYFFMLSDQMFFSTPLSSSDNGRLKHLAIQALLWQKNNILLFKFI